MPLPSFLLLICFVISLAGLTIALFLGTGVPIAALGFVALTGSIAIGLRAWP